MKNHRKEPVDQKHAARCRENALALNYHYRQLNLPATISEPHFRSIIRTVALDKIQIDHLPYPDAIDAFNEESPHFTREHYRAIRGAALVRSDSGIDLIAQMSRSVRESFVRDVVVVAAREMGIETGGEGNVEWWGHFYEYVRLMMVVGEEEMGFSEVGKEEEEGLSSRVEEGRRWSAPAVMRLEN